MYDFLSTFIRKLLRKTKKNAFFIAGFVARKMGIPIQLIAVVNPNDIVHRTFKSGDLSLAPEVKPTWASAMDIQVRLYDRLCHSASKIKRCVTVVPPKSYVIPGTSNSRIS